ncbi:hypothetical protein FS837_011156 [Tulasnella sp. UAMH 9824]|nr:hypothetical protein FS837_011156 [Tulasnella sp. UAMH 9824]
MIIAASAGLLTRKYVFKYGKDLGQYIGHCILVRNLSETKEPKPLGSGGDRCGCTGLRKDDIQEESDILSAVVKAEY